MSSSPGIETLLNLTNIRASDALSSHREETIEVRLLDNKEAYANINLDVEGDINLDFSIYDMIRTGGKMSVANADDINWLNKRVQIIYRMSHPSPYGALSWERSMGVFIPSSPGGSRGAAGRPREIELYDKLLILSQDLVEVSYEVLAGTNVTKEVTDIILSTGETNISIAPSDDTVKAAMVFEAGTSKLQIINKLLDSINYFSLWCDGYGQFRAEKYEAPQKRPLSPYALREGENSVYLEDFTDSEDNFNIPNRIIVVARSDADEEPFTAFAENRDDASPYSYQNRGRWITMLETDVEAANMQRLNEIAQRKLNNVSSVARTFEVSHALLPFDLNEIVRFVNDSNGIDVDCTVQKISFDLTLPGAMMKTTIREVVRTSDAAE